MVELLSHKKTIFFTTKSNTFLEIFSVSVQYEEAYILCSNIVSLFRKNTTGVSLSVQKIVV